ncbi:LysR family transcriptional regulator [Actinomadura barringtoniae]|uniref:LysR family transcriptional regulator n=2 Tax=Actinomadura barringtoniae TaxID=1427535 RepID=A0A939PHT5_9ACTN|nr:LysR family transcriptional regulator [Actinomadura barringtoniae]
MLRVVHRQGTITAAAEVLHLTPSAVSHHMRELSRELKIPLLEPQGRRVRLTQAAHVLLGHADTLLSQWEQTLADLDSHRAGETGPLRMAGFTTAAAGLLAPAAGRLKTTHPDLRVLVRECDTDVSLELLLAGEADLAIIEPTEEAPPPGDPRFDQRPLLHEPLDLAVPAGHPLAGSGAVTLEDVADEAWIVSDPDGCDHKRQLMVHCSAAGFTPRIEHEATTWTVIWSLVANGMGVSLIPRLIDGLQLPGVVRVPLTGESRPTRRLLTCVRRGSREHPVIAMGVRALQDVIDGSPAVAA